MGGLESDLLSFVKNLLTTIGYPGVFLLMMIEGFGIPIPSELTMPFGGFLASTAGGSKFSLPPVILIGAAGELTGSVVAYYLGYYGGRPMLQRYGRFILISEVELEKAETWFRRYGNWIVLVTRLLPAARGFIPLPAGVVRMPFWRFFLYSALGSVVWCAVLAVVGEVLGQHWNSVSANVRKYDVVIIAAMIGLAVFAIYKRLQGIRARRHGEVAPTAE